jgi:hypothetical protein
MSVAVSRVGNPTVFGDKKVTIADLTFTSTYPDEGEPLSASSLGFPNAVQFVLFDGAIVAADGETSLVPKYDYTNSKVLCYEGSAAGTALTEKTASEAYPTNATVRVVAFGH